LAVNINKHRKRFLTCSVEKLEDRYFRLARSPLLVYILAHEQNIEITKEGGDDGVSHCPQYTARI
jgi:hypothetical protein